MSLRGIGDIAVYSVLVLTMIGAAGFEGWTEWHCIKVEHIPVGPDKAAVIARLGQPNNRAHSTDACGKEVKECWTWKLVFIDSPAICFDKNGKVACHEPDDNNIWY